MRGLPGQKEGIILPKRHPRSQALTDPLSIVAGLALIPVGDAWQAKRSKFYHSVEWRHLRNATRARTAGKCERCGAFCPQRGHAHHVVALRLAWSLRLMPSNIQWLCPPCHRAAHGIE